RYQPRGIIPRKLNEDRMEYQKCPICNGNGQVSGGFYNRPGDSLYWATNHTMEICRTCEGKGIIVAPNLEDENQVMLPTKRKYTRKTKGGENGN
ncbi:MAG: hypothetical protein Q8M94_09620, partial [Ignavibacteria bacterium]|nr:hypothetical protein [Ignavibacteria bacterium]